MTGAANVDLTFNGTWLEFRARIDGNARLKNARAEVPGLSQPVEISAARVEFNGERFILRNATANIGKVTLAGGASFPRACRANAPCAATFELATEEFNPERWNDLCESAAEEDSVVQAAGHGRRSGERDDQPGSPGTFDGSARGAGYERRYKCGRDAGERGE